MKMELDFVKNLKGIWELWELRSLMMISLSLQTFLILFAPIRKRTATNWMIMLLWTAYLLADWAAAFAVGLISNTQSDNTKAAAGGGGGGGKNNDSADLLAFWAPILLVHLGGPDTITAFALEDNELWLRHLLSLVTQTSAAAYVFFQSLPENRLWVPTVLMFFSGLIKYLERVISLHGASLNSFRDSLLKDPDPGSTYAKLVNEYHWKTDAHLPTHIELVPEPARGNKGVNRVKEGSLSRTEAVLYAHQFFGIFKGLLVDLIFNQRERDQSRSFFLKRKPRDAFWVIEAELNIMYDVLFTKVRVVYTTQGYCFRFFSFACIVASLGLFYCDDKNGFGPPDVAITYALLLGGIVLDVVSFLMIVTSDWLLVATKKLPDVNIENSPPDEDPRDESDYDDLGLVGKAVRVARRKWCESVSAYSLIHYCMHRRRSVKEEFLNKFGLIKSLDRLRYVSRRPFTRALRNHIFDEICIKSDMAEDLDTAKGISAARGDWVLRFGGHTDLLGYVENVDYDHSLLLWHIATELCYSHDTEKGDDAKIKQYREFSKLLSDYMMYLLIMQPAMMSAVGGIGQIRFRDTCAEAEKFMNREVKKKHGLLRLVLYAGECFLKYFLSPLWVPVKYMVAPRYSGGEEQKTREACRKILEVNTDVKPVNIKGDRSKSVLFDGCILAKKLEGKWEIVSKVWVEMLSYAAINCRAHSHAQELSKGGELITLVWLLMVHLGLGNQYQISQDQGRAKLIVER